MKKIYTLILIIAMCLPLVKVSAQNMSYSRATAGVPKTGNADRIMGNTTQAYINYIQADSVHFPLGYFMSYMFYMNSRYTLQDTGIPMTNELLLQSFSVMFDTIIDANYHDTGYPPNIVQNITVDSLNIIIGHRNTSATKDTIVVQIDSIDAYTGYIIDTVVLHSDTVITSTSLSPGNSWLNPVNLVIRPNPPMGYLVNNNRFGVRVKYLGSKNDTMGFLPGFPYANCLKGGTGPIPLGTKIGEKYGTLRANSLTSGYQYFFGKETEIPTISGNTNGLYLQCTKPSSTYWYFQDNPISAYISFTNTTGINELDVKGFSVNQNYPNPFNKKTEITYNLTKLSTVALSVCDMAGRVLIANRLESVAPGQHSINLDANMFTPGIYFYTFNVNGACITRKMVITR